MNNGYSRSSYNDKLDNCNNQHQLVSSTNHVHDTTLSRLTFNQDGTLFACGIANTFNICDTNMLLGDQSIDLQQRSGSNVFHQTSNLHTKNYHLLNLAEGKQIKAIEMLFRSNIVALIVGKNDDISFTKKKKQEKTSGDEVLIFDTGSNKLICNFTCGGNRVVAVKLRSGNVCVALCNRVFVYGYSNSKMQLLRAFDTALNDAGLLCINTSKIEGNNGVLIAFPSPNIGKVLVNRYHQGQWETMEIEAHRNKLTAIALSIDGLYLATASEHGTIVKLFRTDTKTLLKTFRRGYETARVESLSFSNDNCWLACTSGHGTTHVFKIFQDTGSIMKEYWIGGEKPFVQVKDIKHPKVCSFLKGKASTIVVSGLDEYGNGCMVFARFYEKIEQSGSSSPVIKREYQVLKHHQFYRNINGKEETWQMLSEKDMDFRNKCQINLFGGNEEGRYISWRIGKWQIKWNLGRQIFKYIGGKLGTPLGAEIGKQFGFNQYWYPGQIVGMLFGASVGCFISERIGSCVDRLTSIGRSWNRKTDQRNRQSELCDNEDVSVSLPIAIPCDSNFSNPSIHAIIRLTNSDINLHPEPSAPQLETHDNQGVPIAIPYDVMVSIPSKLEVLPIPSAPPLENHDNNEGEDYKIKGKSV